MSTPLTSRRCAKDLNYLRKGVLCKDALFSFFGFEIPLPRLGRAGQRRLKERANEALFTNLPFYARIEDVRGQNLPERSEVPPFKEPDEDIEIEPC